MNMKRKTENRKKEREIKNKEESEPEKVREELGAKLVAIIYDRKMLKMKIVLIKREKS